MRFFSDLDFYPHDTHLGPRIQTKRHVWTIAVYILLSLGIFARQLTDFPNVRFNVAQFNWSVLTGSFVIGLAIFPPAMRWLNAHRGVPGLEHIFAPFTIGFFLNLVIKTIMKGWLA